jgi:hypothetical protein
MSPTQQDGRVNGRLTNSALLSSMSVPSLGAVHPADRCALCGLLDSEAELRPTVLRFTMAQALVCVDFDRCMRERRERAV